MISIEGGIKWVLWADNAGFITGHDTILYPVGRILNCYAFTSCFRFNLMLFPKSQSTFIGVKLDTV